MLSKRLIGHIRKVCEENQYRVHRRHRHFSFVCERSNIVAVGYAQKDKTHTRAERWFRYNSIHSEFDALRQMMSSSRTLTGLYLVNVRLNAQGNFVLSRPCTCCTRMLRELGIGVVYYSCKDGTFRKMNFE